MSQSAQMQRSENPLIKYFKDFAVLRETRKEYWGLQIINFLDCTVFFSVLTIAVVLLSEDFGFSDERAGYVVTLYGATTTICLFFSGLVTDWLGIKRSLYVSMIGQVITRAAVVVVALNPDIPYRNAIVVVAFFLMAPFVAMVQTLFQAANKRFTTGKSRSAGFNLWYLFMNVGAAAGGFLIDIVRLSLGLPNAHIITFGVFSGIACMLLTFIFIRRTEQLYGADEERVEEAPAGRQNPWKNAWAVLSETIFWRFLVLATLIIPVRAVFLYLHLLWPKYWLRVIGPDARIGTLQAINPILVIVGLIVLIPILHRYSVYKMLVYGAMVSALTLFILAIPSFGNTTYVVSIIALVVLTAGEIIWSPRLNEYTAAIAPEGQEGTYLGLSMVPYFLAKTLVGTLSGHMLTRWVPEYPEGEPILRDRLAAGDISFWNSPSALWLLLGAFALGGPLIALALKGWFTKGVHWERSGRKEEPAEAPGEPAPEPTG
jgi:POT family proton-dependent oligopeptide transporter